MRWAWCGDPPPQKKPKERRTPPLRAGCYRWSGGVFSVFSGGGAGAGQHQRNAHGQRHGDLERGDAVGQGQDVVALDEVVGRVVDARAGHQRENARKQEDRDRRAQRNRKEAGQQRQRDHGQQARRKAFHAAEHGGLVDQPAHGAHQPAVGQRVPGAGEQDGKAQRTGPGQKELCHQLAQLPGRDQLVHPTTTPVSAAASPSTRPVPMAMLAAISSASIIRMVPER